MSQNKNKIDTSNIEIGMKIKNYPEFCRLLKQKVMGGSSKIRQLKRWRRFIEFHRIEGQSYEILDIYEIPKEEPQDKRRTEDKRVGVYKRYAEYLLMQTVLNSVDGNTIRTSKRHFLEVIGIVPPKLKSVLDQAKALNKEQNAKLPLPGMAATADAVSWLPTATKGAALMPISSQISLRRCPRIVPVLSIFVKIFLGSPSSSIVSQSQSLVVGLYRPLVVAMVYSVPLLPVRK